MKKGKYQNINAYLFLMAVLLLIVFSLEFINWKLISQNEGITRIVNLAGRQRMLSQKIAKLSYANFLELENNNLSNLVDQWIYVHNGLKDGSEDMNLKKLDIPGLDDKYDSLSVYMLAIKHGINDFDSDSISKREFFEIISQNEKKFLRLMDEVVFLIDEESDSKVESSQVLSLASSLFAGLAIFLGFTLVLFPSIKERNRYLSELFKNNKIIESQKNQLVNNLNRINNFTDQLSVSERELKKSISKQKDLLHKVVHDVRSPLNNLKSLFQLYEMTDDEKEKKLIEQQINRAYEKGMMMVGMLLEEYSQDNKDLMKPKNISIKPFLESIINPYLTKALKHNIDLILECDELLKATIIEIEMNRAIDNLISNALKFTPDHGSIKLVSFVRDDQDLVFQVIDTGIGISEEMENSIFNKFDQQSSREGIHGEKSTGIGLSIVREVAQKHYGNVKIDSESGRGTKVEIVIPFVRP